MGTERGMLATRGWGLGAGEEGGSCCLIGYTVGSGDWLQTE